jgi:hypothetical protein
VLLVYHFKQRITALEQKCDTMFEIINNIVKEITIIKTNTLTAPSARNPFSFDFFSKFRKTEPVISKTDESDNVTATVKNQEEEEEEEDDDDDEEEEEEEEDDEEEEEEDDEEEGKENANADANNELDLDEEQEPTKILVLDDEPNTIKTISIDSEKVDDANIEMFVQKTENSVKADTSKETYQKMSLAALKSLVTSKGLSSDPNKLKKPELIKLLESA